MIKGIQRKMILVRTPESRFFEEAHLVLRADRIIPADGDDDMVREANRIIEEAGLSSDRSKSGKKRRGSRLGMLLLGGLCGGGSVGLLWLCIALL